MHARLAGLALMLMPLSCLAGPSDGIALIERSPVPGANSGLKGAEPLKVYVATSGVKGLGPEGDEDPERLRYTWSLPAGFDGKPRDVVIILPGRGLTHTWGPRVYSHASWRPGNIVISVDGTRIAPDGGRTFAGEQRDASVFRDLTLEIVRSFPTKRIFLYGHNEGAFFSLMAATRFPRLYNGAVIHGGGIWRSTTVGSQPRGVPLCFLHGTEDQVAPYHWAVDARDALVERQFRTVGLRRVHGHKHEPNASESSIALDFIAAIGTEDAGEALALARSLLAPGESTPPAFSFAYAVLARFTLSDAKDQWPRGFKAATDQQKTEAAALQVKIDALGLKHAAALRAAIKSPEKLRETILEIDAPTPDWIGHLLAVRESFRGVPTVEAVLKDLDADAVLAQHDEASRPLIEAFYTAPPSESLPIIRRQLPSCFLFEALPQQMFDALENWHAEAASMNLNASDLDAATLLRQLLRARERGRKAHDAINATWVP